MPILLLRIYSCSIRREVLAETHPPPWRAAKGRFAYDIFIEIRVPQKFDALGRAFDARETIWWLAALMRLAQVPTLTVPVFSDRSFATIRETSDEADLQPFEVAQKIFDPPHEQAPSLDIELLEWIRGKWLPAGRLLVESLRLYTALKAFDGATVREGHRRRYLQCGAPSKSFSRRQQRSCVSGYLRLSPHTCVRPDASALRCSER